MGSIAISKSLEQLLMHPSLSMQDLESGCELAGELHLASVCVFPAHVPDAARVLKGSDTKVCAAIGFPYGQDAIASRVVAIEQAQSDGAREMAIMLSHAALASGRLDQVRTELAHLLSNSWWGSLASSRGRTHLTVVIEAAQHDLHMLHPLLSDLADTPVGFLQTGSGHQQPSVTAQHVETLRQLLPDDVAIKAVGGIDDLATARELLASGASRVGSHAAMVIAQSERDVALKRSRGEA